MWHGRNRTTGGQLSISQAGGIGENVRDQSFILGPHLNATQSQPQVDEHAVVRLDRPDQRVRAGRARRYPASAEPDDTEVSEGLCRLARIVAGDPTAAFIEMGHTVDTTD